MFACTYTHRCTYIYVYTHIIYMLAVGRQVGRQGAHRMDRHCASVSSLSLSLSLSLPLSRLPYSLCLEAFYLVHPAKDAERRNQGWDTSCGPSSILLVRSVLRVSRPCSRRQSLTDAKLQSLCSPNCKDPKPPKPESLAGGTFKYFKPTSKSNDTTAGLCFGL